jgi:SAM-dependent methyltransferase
MMKLHFNKLCHIEDWDNPWLRLVLRAVQEKNRIGHIIHRKYWEWALGVLASSLSGLLSPKAVVLGLGAGHEIPIYFFTKFAKCVFATDIYGKGKFTQHEADEIMMLIPELYAPFPFYKERLVIEFMDMLNLRFPNNSMDIVFCFSSIEHLPTIKDKKRAFSEMLRVAKPGGLIVLTTEYIINPTKKDISSQVEAFSKKEIEEVFLSQKEALPLDAIDYSISEKTLKTRQPFSAEQGTPDPALPHIVLQNQDVIFTSIFLGFWKKPVTVLPVFPSLKEAENMPYFADPQFFAQPRGIIHAPRNIKIKKDEAIDVKLIVENAGATPWYYSPFSKVPLYVIDSHVYSLEGKELQKHVCCLSVEKHINSGESIEVHYQSAIKLNPGEYILRFNLANCKNEWFGRDGIASWAGESFLKIK